MEGIRDGRPVDDCFVCGLLWPGLIPCPRCGGGMKWVAAQLVDDDAARARVVAAHDAYLAAPSRATLEPLLVLLHDTGLSCPTSLDDLRIAWTWVAPEQVPD